MTVQVQEFSSADALMAHYRALDARKKAQQMRPAPIAARTPVRLLDAPPASEVQPEPECPEARSIYAWPIGPRPFRDFIWISGVAPSRKIIAEVCEKHRVNLRDVRGACRMKHLVQTRHEICYRLRMEVGLSFPAIGRMLGGRDHTTALNSFRRFEKMLSSGTVAL